MYSSLEEIKAYLSSEVNVFIEPLLQNIIKRKPLRPLEFAISWLIKRKSERQVDSESEDDLDVDPNAFFFKGSRAPRAGVCDQVYGPLSEKILSRQLKQEKLGQDQSVLRTALKNLIWFDHLADQTNYLLNSMQLSIAEEFDIVIKEGSLTDQLYIVVDGEFDCYKLYQGSNRCLKTLKKGDFFGDMALLHSIPNPIAVVAKSAGRLYTLGRRIFSEVSRAVSFRKGEFYRQIIDTSPLLSAMSSLQKVKLKEIVVEERFTDGDIICKQGDSVSRLIMILKGSLRNGAGQTYGEGETVDESALTQACARDHDLFAFGDVYLGLVSRESFKRVLGDSQLIFARPV